ncbi:hypothetical protein [Nonomuraea sp. NPDC048916]|uniref:DoxX family protein n=1 Tax=Nonomuraea sp. NPDC048916 TaxID=3154232 RepID=UPI00340C49D3
METTAVLLVALLGFRALGALGVGRFASWPASAAHALAVMLVMTASAHFVPESVTVMPNHADLVRMVPPVVPFAGAMVYLTGVLELLGAAGLVLVRTRRAAGMGLAASCCCCPPTCTPPSPRCRSTAVRRRRCGCGSPARPCTSPSRSGRRGKREGLLRHETVGPWRAWAGSATPVRERGHER